MSIFISDPLLSILSVIAVIFTVASRFIVNKNVAAVFAVIGFLLVIANVIYSLLLGAELSAILTFVLIFALIGVTAFMPVARNADNPSVSIKEESEQKKAGGHISENAGEDIKEEKE